MTRKEAMKTFRGMTFNEVFNYCIENSGFQPSVEIDEDADWDNAKYIYIFGLGKDWDCILFNKNEIFETVGI